MQGQVDCSKQSKLCTEMGVSAYPTIILFASNKNMYKYKGEREVAKLTSFAQTGWRRCWHKDTQNCYQYFPAKAKEQLLSRRSNPYGRIALVVGCVILIVVVGLLVSKGAQLEKEKEANKTE